MLKKGLKVLLALLMLVGTFAPPVVQASYDEDQGIEVDLKDYEVDVTFDLTPDDEIYYYSQNEGYWEDDEERLGGDFYSEDTDVFPRNEMVNPLLRSQNGWVQRNGFWYFYSNNSRQTGWLLRGTSNWYFLHTTTGRMQTGWLQRGSNWYFLNPPRGGAGHNSNRPEGVMLTGWLSRNGNWYYLNPLRGAANHHTGVPEGAMRTGRIWVNGQSYFMNNSGRMQVGWVNYHGNYLFLNPPRSDRRHIPTLPHGAMATGRVAIYDVRHHFNSGGTWQGRATGRNSSVHSPYWWRPANSGATVIPIRTWTAPNNNWTTAMDRAFNDFNANNVNVRFSRNASSTNTVTFLSRPTETFLGRYRITRPLIPVGGTVSEFAITMNTASISNGRSGQRLRNYITSVFAHELAHITGLRDNPTGAGGRNNSIMNSSENSRDRNVVIGLAPFDRASARALYN